ncbi:MAG TPA: DNA primase [Burkholderiales bacterium]
MAGRIPKQFIDDVLLRADIVEVIDARIPLKKAGKDYKACCPFHDEKTPSFTVSPTKQFYHCFGCGAHGTAIGFLMEYEHMSFPEAVEELATRLGLQMPKESVEMAPRADASAELLRILEEASRYYRTQLRDNPRAIAYLRGRGISGEIAAAFGIGYAPDGWNNLTGTLGMGPAETELLVQSGLAVRKEDGRCYDRFRDRVMFPIHDYRGRIVGFGGRVIDAGEPKYLNSPETVLFHKGRELYGLFKARDSIKTAGRVLVVEGYMDVVALAQHGVGNVVATLGTATTREHIERLFRYAPEVVFSFDGDRAGREAAARALETVLPVAEDGRQVSFLFLPEGEDPDSLVRREGGEAFSARFAGAKPLPDFFFESLASQVDLRRMDGRTRLAELARPLIARLPPGMFRDMMIERLAEISRVPAARLATLVGKSNAAFERDPRGFARPFARPVQQPRQPSIVWMAAAILVQHPELGAKAVSLEFLEDLDRPGMSLFRQLVETSNANPRCNTAALVEHFRDTEHETHVARLAAWNHPALDQDIDAEFTGVLNQMRRAAIKAKVEHLLQKQKIYGLTSLEIGELAHLTRIQVEKTEAAH